MPIFLRPLGYILLIGVFFTVLPEASGSLPLTAKEILLMLRGGYSKTDVTKEIVTRKVVDSLTPDLQKQLISAGADATLIATYQRSQLTAQDANAARADLTQRQMATEASRARTLDEIAHLPAVAPAGVTGSASAFLQQFQGDLIVASGQKAHKFGGSLSNKRFVAVYFSASWCGPCRKFTPDFVQFYRSLKTQHDDFEVIFVSRDEDEKAMLAYMTGDQMPWPALSFQASPSAKAALEKYAGSGIPNLVLLDPNGQVLSQSYRNGEYVGPREVLRDWLALYGSKQAR